MKLWSLALLILVAVSATASAGELTTIDGRPIRNVAVISRLGDSVRMVLDTSRVFGRQIRRGDVDASGWNVDQHIEQRIGGALAARFAVAPLTANETAGRGKVEWTADDVVENFSKFGARPELDAYVVVVTAIDSEDFYPDEIDLAPIWGLGLYHRTGVLAVDSSWVFAIFDVVVLDAKTGKEIARQRGRTDGEWNYASDIADARLWPGDVEKAPQPEQIALIRNAISALVDKSVDWTLKKMKLAP